MSSSTQSAESRSWAICVSALAKRYGSQVLFDELSLEVRPGEALRIVGPNGSGKTQLLLCLGGFVRPDSGRVRVRTDDGEYRPGGTPWNRDSWLRFVPSVPGEIQHSPIALAAFALSRSLSPYSLGSVSRAAADRFFGKWGERLGEIVGEELQPARPMNSLSLGQQKRLMLASVLLCAPAARAYLVDEPLAGLDGNGLQVALDLLDATRKKGAALLVAEHREDIAAIAFDRELSLPHHGGRRSPRPAEVVATAEESLSAAKPSDKPVLVISNARVGYPGAEVRCKKLTVAPGEIVLIEGGNGSGKTGFLKGLLGIAPSTLAGRVAFDGTCVQSLAAELPRGRVRYLDQGRGSFDDLTVADAVHAATAPGQPTPAEIRETVGHLGARKRVAALSSGNRALLGLCQTLAARPALVILDEPFANVDSKNRRRMLALISEARAQSHTAFLIVEHTGDDLRGSRRHRICSTEGSQILKPLPVALDVSSSRSAKGVG